MSDATAAVIVTTVVAGAVNIVGMVVGFFTLWVKLKHASTKAEEAVMKAAVVEGKLDANTLTTRAVDAKADTIVQQTNGSLEHTRALVASISERVGKLEDYNRDSSHRILDGLHAINLRVAEIAATQSRPAAAAQARTEIAGSKGEAGERRGA